MEISLFSKTCKRILDQYFKKIEGFVDNGQISINGNSEPLFKYPTMIITAKTEEVFYFELVGSSPIRKPLRIKKSSIKDIEKAISLNDKNEYSGYMFNVCGNGSSLINMIIGSADSNVNIDINRFPISKYFKTNLSYSPELKNTILFADDFVASRLSNILITSSKDNIYKARYISEMLFFHNKIDIDDLEKSLENYCSIPSGAGTIDLLGIYLQTDENTEKEMSATHLQNLVLLNGVHETAIGDFLYDHPDILLNALGYEDFLYETSLNWIHQVAGNHDKSIRPDLLLKRPDGNYDICDLKKGLVNRKSLTQDDRKRRRFIDPVNEGIAQLANYEEYFTYSENADYAKEKFNISVSSPNKILIIGNKDNANEIEIKEALRGTSNISVFDYESIISLYLANTRKLK